MKTISFILLFFFLITGYTQGQNLVPNPSFEIYDTCYINDGALDTSATFFPRIDNWMAASVGCSGITFTPCQGNAPFTQIYGYHVAHSGVSYASFSACAEYPIVNSIICHLCTNTRSYLQVQLAQPLKKDTQYCVDFFVENAANEGIYVGTSSVGAYLSVKRPVNDNTTVQNSLIRGIKPQIQNAPNNFITDTLHWQSIHGIYKAQGGEQWLTIGNFYNDTLTPLLRSFFYIGDSLYMDSLASILVDDVSVTPITFPQASKDTLLCDTSHFTETLQAQPGGDYYQWSTGDTSLQIIIHQPGTYWFNTDFGCGPVVDSIHINYQPPLSGHLPTDTNGCAANMPLYLGIDSGFAHYAWNTGDTIPVIAISDSGTYNVHAVYACGAFSDTVHVVVYPQPALPVAIDTGVCVNTGNYPAVITGTNIHYYSSVSDSTGSLLPPVISTTLAADYTFYAAQQISGCFSGRSVEQIQVIATPVPDVINNLVLCEGESVQIGDVNSSYHYQWNTGDTTNLILTGTAGIYVLTESNTCGNVVEQITVSETNCSSCLFVPNVFTPNGDGNNDVFKVFTNCPLNFFRCMIFDRIGEKVFESHNPLETWDGTYKSTKLSPGVFVYEITYVSANEETESLKGSVTLIR